MTSTPDVQSRTVLSVSEFERFLGARPNTSDERKPEEEELVISIGGEAAGGEDEAETPEAPIGVKLCDRQARPGDPVDEDAVALYEEVTNVESGTVVTLVCSPSITESGTELY